MGPALDGRLKPDLVAFGSADTMYTTSTTSYAGSLGGTSASTPQVTGSLTLLQELYAQLYPGEDILSSTLKGLALHTATDLDIDLDDYSSTANSTGVNGPSQAGNHRGPDYGTGWGLLNTELAAEVMLENASKPRIRPHIKGNHSGA